LNTSGPEANAEENHPFLGLKGWGPKHVVVTIILQYIKKRNGDKKHMLHVHFSSWLYYFKLCIVYGLF